MHAMNVKQNECHARLLREVDNDLYLKFLIFTFIAE